LISPPFFSEGEVKKVAFQGRGLKGGKEKKIVALATFLFVLLPRGRGGGEKTSATLSIPGCSGGEEIERTQQPILYSRPTRGEEGRDVEREEKERVVISTLKREGEENGRLLFGKEEKK